MDRSLNTDRNVFAQMLYDDKEMSELEYNMYNCWNDFYSKHVRDISKIKTIYLRCDPEIAHKRIMKRGRDEEKHIKLDYIRKVHDYHEKWLNTGESNILVLDCNIDFELDEEYLIFIIEKIKLFM